MSPCCSHRSHRARALLVAGGFLIASIHLTGIAGAAESVFGLYKSADQGASWVRAGHGLPHDTRVNALNVAGRATIAGTDRGVFVSFDAGAKWQPASQGVGTEARVLCLATQAGRVFAGTQRHGVLVSGDDGATWQPMNYGLTDRHVRSLLIAGSSLYAGTDRQGVFVSADTGATWTNLKKGLPDSAQVFDLAAADGDVFAALYSKGLYRWDARGGTWTKAGEVAPLELVTIGATLVVGHNPGGVFVSEDHGRTWEAGNLGLPLNAPVWTLAADAKQVFVGTTGKLGTGAEIVSLFSSEDHGKSWTRSDKGLPRSGAAVSFAATKDFVLVGISSPKAGAPDHQD